jgi:hypothetical protein
LQQTTSKAHLLRPQSTETESKVERTMLNLVRTLKFAAAVVGAVTVSSVQSYAQSPAQTGTVRLNIVKAGFIVGAGGGSGILHYHGRTYHLSIGGIGIGSLGIASVSLVGTASNLRAPGDIAGVYGAAGAGATFIGGAQVATLQNEKGVVLALHGAQVGFQVSLGLAGMTIALR